jgi:hypothetical protein
LSSAGAGITDPGYNADAKAIARCRIAMYASPHVSLVRSLRPYRKRNYRPRRIDELSRVRQQ